MRVSVDGFLDNRLQIAQPQRGWRAGLEAVLLASAIAARPREKVCEFGAGSGAAALCLAWRMGAWMGAGAQLVGVEKNAALVQLARANAARNQLQDRVAFRALDIAARSFLADLGGMRFGHVFFNPPYYAPEKVRASPNRARRAAQLRAPAGLGLWVRRAASILRAQGCLTLIHRADALGEVLAHLAPAFGATKVLPVQPRAQEPAHRVLVQAQLGRRAPLALLPPLVLENARGEVSRPARAILRGGRGLAL